MFMDVQTVTQLISALGFPIVCCGALFWYINKTMKEFTYEMKSSIDKLADTISKDTEATIHLLSTVEVISKIGGDYNVDRSDING